MRPYVTWWFHCAILGLGDNTINEEITQAFNITPPFRLENFAYNNEKLLEIIFGHLHNTSYTGLTVKSYRLLPLQGKLHRGAGVLAPPNRNIWGAFIPQSDTIVHYVWLLKRYKINSTVSSL